MENSIATINQGRPVYFSYARNSSKKPEWEHISDCVEPLLNTLTDNEIEYRVDIKDIGNGDKISKFEQEIGWNSELVVIIFSDKYFRSMHCMYEFVQIKRALEKYPTKRLMGIKCGDFNLADVSYIRELERYWNSQKFEYEDIEYHRLRELSETEKAAWQNGFYIEDIRKLYSFFSAINYTYAQSIDYKGFVLDIIKYYETTPKSDLTPKPSEYVTVDTFSAPQYSKGSEKKTSPKTIHAQVDAISTSMPSSPQHIVNTSTTENNKRKFNFKILGLVVIGAIVLSLLLIFNRSNEPKQSPDSDLPYADLGLPSGTLWATCNLGANNPWDYGDFYAWGETQSKSDFSPSTYKYSSNKYLLTKYCNDPTKGYNGFTDMLTTLEPSDDAAIAVLGAEWCMPTNTQFQELIDFCSWSWCYVNNVGGCAIVGKNGNSIFLPASGVIWGEELKWRESLALYWSTALNEEDPNYAWRLSIDANDGYNLGGGDSRSSGLLIRAVRSK